MLNGDTMVDSCADDDWGKLTFSGWPSLEPGPGSSCWTTPGTAGSVCGWAARSVCDAASGSWLALPHAEPPPEEAFEWPMVMSRRVAKTYQRRGAGTVRCVESGRGGGFVPCWIGSSAVGKRWEGTELRVGFISEKGGRMFMS